MTYAFHPIALHGDGDGGARRLAAGQLVLARFQPSGVSASNTNVVTNALGAQMASTGAFKTPEYIGWGADDNNGLIVFRAQMKTGQLTPVQVANKIKAVMPALEQALGGKRLTFLTIRHPAPSGEVVPAATPDTPVTPDTGGGGGGGGSGGGSPGAPEESTFFTRKVLGVPAWMLGSGVLLVSAVAAVFLLKKPKGSGGAAKIQANRGRVNRNPGKEYYIDESGERRELPEPDVSESLESFVPIPAFPVYIATERLENKARPRRFARRRRG